MCNALFCFLFVLLNLLMDSVLVKLLTNDFKPFSIQSAVPCNSNNSNRNDNTILICIFIIKVSLHKYYGMAERRGQQKGYLLQTWQGHDLPALLQSSSLRYQKLVDVMLVSCLKKSNCCSFRSSLFFLMIAWIFIRLKLRFGF